MEPKTEAKIMPTNLLLFPRQFEIVLSGTRKRTIETRMSMVKKAGKIFTNFLTAILIAISVFLQFAIRENAKANAVTIYR